MIVLLRMYVFLLYRKNPLFVPALGDAISESL